MPDEAILTPRLEKLTSSIREMASRVNAEFVLDSQKSQTYGAASDISNQTMSGSRGPSQRQK
jgi:hypothetical protein